MNEHDAHKAAMRTAMRRSLRAIDSAELPNLAAALHARITEQPRLATARSVMVYAAVASWAELNLAPLARLLLAGGTRVALPRVGPPHSPPRAAWITDWDRDVIPGTTAPAVPGPRAELPDAPPDQLDAIIVPGLAFDSRGHRLGRGGGWYDRFMARMRVESLRLGAAVDAQIVAEVPSEVHDQRVDIVLTPTRTIIAHPPRHS